MKKNFLLLALMLTTATVMTSCKNDSEDGLKTSNTSVTGLYINEVCSSDVDWVELYNATDNELSLSGFRLQDNKGVDEEYIFPEGTTIKSRQYLVLEKEASFTFGISSGGDEIKLLDSQYQTIDQVVVPALESGATYARSTDGGTQWVVTLEPTKGGSNSAASNNGASDK